jgi:predicted RNA-binding Zn ribbon-like protein
MARIATTTLGLTPSWRRKGSTYQLSWPEATQLDAMLWPVGLAAGELLTSPQLSRLKKCAGCPWLFLDQSKNLSRRWCTREDCGTHEKILRYVARRASRRQVLTRSKAGTMTERMVKQRI